MGVGLEGNREGGVRIEAVVTNLKVVSVIIIVSCQLQ